MGARSRPRNVVLIGGMGAGKSTVGAALAGRLGFTFFDTDAMVEQAAGRSIAQLWADEGEDAFRRLEHEAVLKACAGEGRVIACGGGAILQLVNYGVLKDAGTVVYLRAPGAALWRRVAGSDRPLAVDRDSFDHLLAERAPAYESAADHVVDSDRADPQALAAQIEALL